jgi:hypothetical protein
LQNRFAVARAVEQKLGAAVESDEKIFVRRMTRVDKSFERFSGFADFLAAHRIGNVKQNTDRNRRVGVAEKRDFLFFVVVEHAKSVFAQAGNKSSVKVCNR